MQVGRIVRIDPNVSKDKSFGDSLDTWEFTIVNDSKDIMEYLPGQFMSISIEDPELAGTLITRQYSISSTPSGQNYFKIVVTKRDSGPMSNYLFFKAKIGDYVMLRGPIGKFTLPDNISRDIVMISTGTGVAPFRSMIRYIYKYKVPVKTLHLISGARYKRELPYYHEFVSISEKHSNFTYDSVVSREAGDGRLGYVQDHLDFLEGDLSQKPLVYICGGKDMVKSVRHILEERGFEFKRDIVTEVYG